MGCNIHLHTEVKIKGRWHHYGAPSLDRDYLLFERMAGVRGKLENAIVLPKGLPVDATDITLLDYERCRLDARSQSWLDANEIAELEAWYNERTCRGFPQTQWGYLFGHRWAAFSQGSLRERLPAVEDIRFVFWFDN